MVDRIRHIMEYYDLSAAQFADTIGIQRSALSHVLSERNKPSLDFVLKVKRAFPEVRLDWLTLGQGEMYSESNEQSELSIPSDFDIRPASGVPAERMKPEEDMQKTEESVQAIARKGRDVEEIVVFYSDHSFRRFVPDRE